MFEISELIETILSFLQPKEIISCRRLSTRFRDEIDASILLQELMFLRITRVPQQSWRMAKKINGHGKGITSVRPIFGIHSVPGNWEGFILPHRTRTVSTLNSTFPPSQLYETRDRDPDVYHSGSDHDGIMLSADDPLLKYARVQSCTPSLLGMYLTNPPRLEAWIYFKVLHLPSRFVRVQFSAWVQRPTGITIGDVLHFASSVKGVGIYRRPEPPELPEERNRYPQISCRPIRQGDVYLDDLTMFEFLDFLNAQDGEDRVELYGELRCESFDTIIPTDRMRAGVTPYVETGAEPKYSPGEDWLGVSSEEEADEGADEEAGEEDADAEN